MNLFGNDGVSNNDEQNQQKRDAEDKKIKPQIEEFFKNKKAKGNMYLMVYSLSCGHCKSALPKWEKIHSKNGSIVAKIQSKNATDIAEIEKQNKGYVPLFLHFSKDGSGNISSTEHKGGHEEADFKNWVQGNGTIGGRKSRKGHKKRSKTLRKSRKFI
jgi:thiol-disulfide isomerase/thioredoxin